MSRVSNFTRWVAVIPGGIAGGIAASAVAGVILGTGSYLAGLGFSPPMNLLTVGAVFGYASTRSAQYIVPVADKRWPSIVFVAVLTCLALGFGILNTLQHNWLGAVQYCVVVAGAVFATTVKE